MFQRVPDAGVEFVQSLGRETFNLPPPARDLLHDHDFSVPPRRSLARGYRMRLGRDERVPTGLSSELVQLLRRVSLALVLPRQQPVLIKLAGAGLVRPAAPLGPRPSSAVGTPARRSTSSGDPAGRGTGATASPSPEARAPRRRGRPCVRSGAAAGSTGEAGSNARLPRARLLVDDDPGATAGRPHGRLPSTANLWIRIWRRSSPRRRPK